MGYERNDRRYGRDQGYGARDYGRDQSYGRQDEYRGGYDRDRGGYGRQPQGYDYDDRGFFDRAGDEVRSWFGDEEAERRRRWDERNAERDYQRHYGQSGYGNSDYDRSRYGQSSYGQSSYGSFDSDRGRYGQADRGYEQGRDRSYGGNRDDRSQSYSDRGSYGAGSGGFGSQQSYGSTGNDRGSSSFGGDSHYRSWRDRQMADLDRDYDDYRRENQSKFESEFGSWRQTRQTQRQSLGKVQEHQDVVGSDGQHVGTVDKVRGDRIILTKQDTDAHGHHHSIPCSWIQSVDDKVTISKTADEAKSHWRDEERNSAFGSNDRSNSDRSGDNNRTDLNRSFSGTY
ncbi:DUF2171 domain-containing protein [Sphingomonas jatrophae]|uniref:DUF2171 domain-containing protein n=1 Tax=Sphingomonas jatrophae TaxID=1166337 RepID=A0A1I6K3K9_9SPHN|nr:DUF2171 domain-containing protein [Sphingomonas jatrophae]SFR85777.1 hypothetical protein SAMN05192580_1290 [Sphingomonas jatrophae]